MAHDPFDVAIDQILEGADGDVRLALRTMLVQRLELEAEFQALQRMTDHLRTSKSHGTER